MHHQPTSIKMKMKAILGLCLLAGLVNAFRVMRSSFPRIMKSQLSMASVLLSNGILKTLIRSGTSMRLPVDGDKVECKFRWFDKNGTMVFDGFKKRDCFVYLLGEGPFPGWDLSMKTMREGEVSRFVIPPELAFGKEGKTHQTLVIGPDEHVELEIEMRYCYNAKEPILPIMDDKEEDYILKELKERYNRDPEAFVNYAMDEDQLKEKKKKETEDKRKRDALQAERLKQMYNPSTNPFQQMRDFSESTEFSESPSVGAFQTASPKSKPSKFYDPTTHHTDPNQKVRGVNADYMWEETPLVIDVKVKLPLEAKKSNIHVDIRNNGFNVTLQENPPIDILSGILYGKVQPGESSWMIVDKRFIEVENWDGDKTNTTIDKDYHIVLSLAKRFDFQDIWATVFHGGDYVFYGKEK